MVLNYGYRQSQSQRLSLTAERKMSLAVLQLNRYKLQEYLLNEWTMNPMLEVSNDGDGTYESVDFLREDRMGYESIRLSSEDFFENIPYHPDLKQFLKMQLSELTLSSKHRRIAEYIIESLDDEGFFREKTEFVCKCLRVSEKELSEALAIVQSLEPEGIGAVDFKDCLRIQAREKGLSNIVLRIIDGFLPEVAKNDVLFVSKKLKCADCDVQQSFDRIRSLNPIPANGFVIQNTPVKYRLPDVRVECVADGIHIYHFSEMEYPLRIDESYYQMMRGESGGETYRFLHEHYLSAQMILRSVQQRRDTLREIMKAIVVRQRDFFRHGSFFLAPMSLKDIASDVGMSESTISRAVRGKTMETPYGIMEWKNLFTRGIETSHSQVSTNHIRNMIGKIISKEDAACPLSDRKISEILTQMGFPVARRTVQKYREELKISSTRLRRRFE